MVNVSEAHVCSNPFDFEISCKCSTCGGSVPWNDFLFCYKAIEGAASPTYTVTNICRKCRDSGRLVGSQFPGSKS